MNEMITISKEKYFQVLRENETLRNTYLYKRLLEAERNIALGRKFTRKDIGF